MSLFPPNDAWYGGNRATAALLPMQYYNFATAEKIVQCSVLSWVAKVLNAVHCSTMCAVAG